MIEVAEKSMLWVRFTILGKQCHASTPHKGRNSLVGASRLVLGLQDLHERFSEMDPIFSPPCSTFAPTRSEENIPNVNTIPGKNVFYLDCRILPFQSVEGVFKEIEQIARAVEQEMDVRILVESVQWQEAPPPTPADAPVVKALIRAIRDVSGKEARPMGIGGGTVAAFFRKAGLPAAVWYTGSETAHQPDEFCLIPNVIHDAKVFARLFMGDSKGGEG